VDAIEVRYPFDNTLEFIQGGHIFQVEGLHLLLASVLIPVGILWTLRCTRGDWLRAISILYFGLQPFNNPAFTNFGLVPGDLCGVVIAAAALYRFTVREVALNPLLTALASFGVVALVHASLIWLVDPAFAQEASLFARYTIIVKTIVMTLAFTWIYNTQEPAVYLPQLVRSVAGFIIICCVVYVAQLAVFLFGGVIPYGSFSGSGYSLSVSFGGVSIERGHLAKFMAPLFCPLLLYCVLYRRRLIGGVYGGVMLVNFSASGLAFLAFQTMAAIVLFGRWTIAFLLRPFGLLVAAGTVALLVSFSQAYSTLLFKIYDAVIRGNEAQRGGRSIGLLIDYLTEYPFGIGYSGSSFRTAPGMAEINMGLYSFFTQMSFIALVYVALTVFGVAKAYFQYKRGSTVARILLAGALALPFVFVADILWFVPLWWLPLFMLLSWPRVFQTMSDVDWQQAADAARIRRRATKLVASPA
jgi:hypothetical protein